ncbi:MAG: isoprenylcysteine carboxylmethyltransferase family protein [Armatimonadetes bacterium]|nr:isoprenylcysteine carboxylmethyltransferase family protein [Armatimonadota bacterium]
MTRLASFLARNAPGERPPAARAVAVLLGLALFGAVVPALLVLLARRADPRGTPLLPPPVGWALVVLGAALALWTVAVQVTWGRGTPVPLLPTQALLTSGPYRLCRNPMVLGALTAYLGLLLTTAGLLGASVAGLAILAVAQGYHRGVEEHELALRFGDAYLAYRARTPFLLPTWTSLRRCLARRDD